MFSKGSDSLKKWTLNLGAFAAVVGAIVLFTFVLMGYFEHDVFRMRGLVLSFVLVGLAFIVRSEANAYVPVQRHHSR